MSEYVREGKSMRILPEQEKQRLITVALDGSGDYRSIKEAVDHAPGGTAEQRTVIHIRDGVYNEKLHIEKPFLHLVGKVPKEPSLHMTTTPEKRSPTAVRTILLTLTPLCLVRTI